jgi:signal transduction histidine kinase
VGLPGDPSALIREDHGLGNVRRRVATAGGGEGSLELSGTPAGRGVLARITLPARVRTAARLGA